MLIKEDDEKDEDNEENEEEAKTRTAADELCDAAVDGDCATIERILEDGTLEIDALGDMGMPGALGPVKATAFHCAIHHSHQDDQCEAAALFLLDRGANPNIANSEGLTPLIICAGKGILSAVQLLLEAKANLDVKDPRGATAFHWGCITSQHKCVEALVRAGCDTTVCPEDGLTGWDCVCQNGDIALLERLRSLQQPDAAAEDIFWSVRADADTSDFMSIAAHEDNKDPDDLFELDIKPENLLLRNGVAVIIQGLQKSPQWNGQRGLIQSFDRDKRRYEVKIGGRNRVLRVKMHCCMPEAFVDM